MCKGEIAEDRVPVLVFALGLGWLVLQRRSGTALSGAGYLQHQHELGTYHSDILTLSGLMSLTIRQTETSLALEGT